MKINVEYATVALRRCNWLAYEICFEFLLFKMWKMCISAIFDTFDTQNSLESCFTLGDQHESSRFALAFSKRNALIVKHSLEIGILLRLLFRMLAVFFYSLSIDSKWNMGECIMNRKYLDSIPKSNFRQNYNANKTTPTNKYQTTVSNFRPAFR